MSESAIRKWDRAAKTLDLNERGEELRYGVFKKALFAKATGRTLLVAAGTGIDFKHFPPDIEVTAIDFSPKMLEMARQKVEDCPAPLTLVAADVTDLDYPDGYFDTVVTSCTFRSVPDPVKGLREVRRVLRDGGRLLMFEHVRPSTLHLGRLMDLMNPLVRKVGPEINRRTADNVRAAGFRLVREFNVYLDMVKLFEAEKA
ncbi:MAG: methyltransferase domain-containing protein [Xanthomonadales bacterium]|nr:methyltransferase domain-containing protein [Xanthomonadales bacterium]NIN58415.1 methyltransferase domain-containing protein [Xanthomonadales bacterium]NIN73752.1 methyltransferase domain-containing protein [Xanthomonadales bacterium]NIO14550.1 methyltransferase domain-containing protein [Xanthomonadales bacterium]NIP10808.1 methyltransferase domain-containing protein [Xanthomonadales bacterium]